MSLTYCLVSEYSSCNSNPFSPVDNYKRKSSRILLDVACQHSHCYLWQSRLSIVSQWPPPNDLYPKFDGVFNNEYLLLERPDLIALYSNHL